MIFIFFFKQLLGVKVKIYTEMDGDDPSFFSTKTGRQETKTKAGVGSVMKYHGH